MISREIGGLFALLAKLRRCAPHLLQGATNRRDLALLELQETVRKCVVSLVMACAAALLLCLAAVSLTFIIAAIYWDTPQRVTALVILASVEAFLGIAGFLWLWLSWKRWKFFQTTLEQLEKDTECLSHLIQSPQSAKTES